MMHHLILGDCVDKMRDLAPNSVGTTAMKPTANHPVTESMARNGNGMEFREPFPDKSLLSRIIERLDSLSEKPIEERREVFRKAGKPF